MKTLILLFTVFSLVCCTANGRSNQKTNNSKPPALHDTIRVGYFGNSEPSVAELKPISEEEFNAIPQNESRDSAGYAKQTNKYFEIKTAQGKVKFDSRVKTFPKNGSIASYYTYFGYFPKLQLYGVYMKSTSIEVETGEFYFIDSLTSTRFNILSRSTDGAIELPEWSPSNQQLVYCANGVHENMIGLINYNGNASVDKRFNENKYWEFEGLEILAIKWIDNNTLAIKIKSEDTGAIQYFTFSI